MKRAVILSPPVSALILALRPAAALLGFDAGNEAGAAQAWQLGRMPLVVDAMNVSIGAAR